MADKTSRWDKGATFLMAGCAVLMAGTYLYNQAKRPPDPNAPIYIEDWESHVAGSMRIGNPSGQVVLVEYSDFQCPFCRQLAQSIDTLLLRYPNDLHVVFRNFPITQLHPFARAAALNAYCAGKTGRFQALHDYYFANVDSLGVEPWNSMALKAGITDTLSLTECVSSQEAASAVSTDSTAAESLGVGGTPTVLINGRRFAGAPPLHMLDSLVAEILAETK